MNTGIHSKERINYTTGEVEEVNNNFVQLYVDKLDLIIQITEQNPSALKVLTWLLKHMDKRNALVISQNSLSDALNLSRSTVHRAITYLREKKVITMLKTGTSNVYVVNAQIAWKSNAQGKKYALFDAKVYVSELEQEDLKPIFKTELFGTSVRKESKKTNLTKNENKEKI